MKFSQELREEAQPIIERIYNDNFIQELLVGTLPKQAVRQYLRADASYLKNLQTYMPYLFQRFTLCKM